MAILDKILGKEVATFSFEFDPDFESNSTMAVRESGLLDQAYYNWVWSLYYVKTLYTLGNSTISVGLKDCLEQWAERLAPGMGFPLQVSEEMGLCTLDKELRLVNELRNPDKDVYLLGVLQRQNKWPYIKTSQSGKAYQNRFACSVIGLGQYFINKNTDFTRELPLHILSARKYYRENRPFTDIKSTTEAPAFVIRESMKIWDHLGKELDAIEKELDENR